MTRLATLSEWISSDWARCDFGLSMQLAEQCSSPFSRCNVMPICVAKWHWDELNVITFEYDWDKLSGFARFFI